MKFLAAFIGIDRHQDPGIRELEAARRDATALWALFSDTFPDVSAKLLVDETATTAAVLTALDETLGAAGLEDVVVVSFSGHGTHDHRLVMHDTSRADVPATTIPMSELASRFKVSKAKAVLCILDCCFSGGAPARVLEDTPVSRDPGSPLEAIAGAGRILIAASNVNEPALESGQTRHGLLTKAVLDAFQTGDEVSVTSVMDRIMSEVRAEAARMGYQQTPVLLGHVEGGLMLPALKRGDHFFGAFPESRTLRLTGPVRELESAGLPGAIVDAWEDRFSGGLNALQLAALNDHGILAGESLLVVAPTSSGKTFIGELAAARAVTDGRKAVFLFPYKALVNEKYDQFRALYGNALAMRVVRCTGDYQDETRAFINGKFDLAVLTYEMFLNLSVSVPSTLNQLGLIVLDEAQFIADPHRGIVVELLLTLILTARERAIAPQLIALSAVIGDLNDFDRWLGTRTLVTKDRPVPLIEGVLDRSGTYQFVDEAGGDERGALLPTHAIRQRRDKPSAQDVIVPLVQKLLRENPSERVIVFRNTRGPAEGCAGYLSRELGRPPAMDVIAALSSHDLSTTSRRLRSCLSGGTAFHNSNLARDEREVIERAFRDPNGPVVALAATTTVAAGINTPASTVILAEQEFVGEDGRPFTVAEYKNMAGRAGRYGFNEKGRSIILAGTPFEREQLFRKYVRGTPEPIHSSFDPEHLETWVLRLLAQVERVPRADVVTLLANTYGGYLAGVHNPSWRPQMTATIERLLNEMGRLGLTEEERGVVSLTLLGQACGRSSLSFPSAMRLIDILRARPKGSLPAELLMVILQVLAELDGVHTPIMARGTKEGRWVRDAAMHWGNDVANLLSRFAGETLNYWRRCKRALVLEQWIRGRAMDAIENDFTVNPFNAITYGSVRQFADATRFHLRPAYQIASLVLLVDAPAEDDIDALLRRLEVGVPADALPLLELPIPLSRGEYLALFSEGLTTSAAVWAAAPERLETVLGKARVSDLTLRRLSS